MRRAACGVRRRSIPWTNVSTQFEHDTNQKQMAVWNDVCYLFNPPDSRLKNLVAERQTNKFLRLLCDSQSFVFCLRFLMEERSAKLKTLFTAISAWQRTFAASVLPPCPCAPHFTSLHFTSLHCHLTFVWWLCGGCVVQRVTPITRRMWRVTKAWRN
jgi:hypothetical protein